MKSKKNIILLISFLLCFFWFTFAWNLRSEDKANMDYVMTVVDRQWSKDSVIDQISKYETTIKAFSVATFKDQDQKAMVDYLVSLFKQKVSQLKSQMLLQSDIVSNVDWDRVRSERLSWHNNERIKKWLSEYIYDNSLDYTALTWASQIANEKRKTWSTHARKSGDWYRNTNSIKEWFSDLWLDLVYFSESNAYGYYNCKKSDCTSEIISVLRKCFDRTYMNSWHYPAIVSKLYNKIWFWVAINDNYLRITTHYAE